VGGPNIGITVLEESLEVQAGLNNLETWFLTLFVNQSIWLSPLFSLYIIQANGSARFIYRGWSSTRLRPDPLTILEKQRGETLTSTFELFSDIHENRVLQVFYASFSRGYSM